ncbi:MAG: hypothetical protein HEEMFOPI_01027 [Holosporales bacterium]
MKVLNFKLAVLGMCLLSHFSKAAEAIPQQDTPLSRIVCQTGEVFFIDPKYSDYKVALADSPVVYIEDSKGKIRSYEASDKKILQRTKLYRLPVMGFFYNLMNNNYYTLKTPTNDGIQKWAISRTMYDGDPNCITISLYVMLQSFPIILENHDPWLHPSQSFTHKGPDIYGVHITAIDQWVAISGYNCLRQKVVAFKQMNYDLMGHNFFMTYQTDPQTQWSPNKLYKKIGKKIGVSQTPVNIPFPDWQTIALEDDSLPNIMLKRVRNSIVLCIPRTNLGFKFITLKNDAPYDFRPIYQVATWPELEFAIKLNSLIKEFAPKKATLNGRSGMYYPSSQEPLDGHFVDEETKERTEVYKIIDGVINFLQAKYSFVDKNKSRLKLVLSSS